MEGAWNEGPGANAWHKDVPLGSDACGPDGGRSHGPVQVFRHGHGKGDDTRVWHSWCI